MPPLRAGARDWILAEDGSASTHCAIIVSMVVLNGRFEDQMRCPGVGRGIKRWLSKYNMGLFDALHLALFACWGPAVNEAELAGTWALWD